ncbi:MAG TPA: hypothetical protein VGD99_18865 [Anaerolineae bacterium]|jgi:hypothetical protein
MHIWSNPKIEQEIAQERYQIIIQAREQTQATSSDRVRGTTFYDTILFRLGSQLVIWGNQLQQRYNAVCQETFCRTA